MSDDYQDRKDWLNRRKNTRAGRTSYEVLIRPMPAGGRNKDPGLFHVRHKGPLIRAIGHGSYDEWKAAEALKRRQRRAG